ncbi:tRNA-dihydrouridine synthase family protein [Candidatus Saccharibacteria bacterium]|nr:tRNA-dihydrouridine synthase family protein [Candidatus Saccharibacteria bacterium]
MTVWDSLKKPIFCLAPMEGVTDRAFRGVIAAAARPDLFFTEFTNVSSFASEQGRTNALNRLKISATDSPIIAQIWGKNPNHFATLASSLKSLGFSGIDLNFGCPDRHVNRAGGGAAMIRTPDLAIDCLRRAKLNSNGLPVSIKTRLGFTYLEEYKDWLPTLLKERPAALTVHLRTRKEMSKVPAHFELIPDLLALRETFSPETKLLINGDLKSRAMCLDLWQQYPSLDGFMLGRAIFDNPYLFSKDNHVPTKTELFNLLNLHLDLYESNNIEPLKHYFKIYIKDFNGASALRTKLMECKDVESIRLVLRAGRQDRSCRRTAAYERGPASATPATAGGRDSRPAKRTVDRKRANAPLLKSKNLI